LVLAAPSEMMIDAGGPVVVQTRDEKKKTSHDVEGQEIINARRKPTYSCQ